MSSLLFVIVVVILASIYNYYNGANDSANSIATTVSTRALTPRQAVLMAAVLNMAGAFITTEVAKTMGKGIVEPSVLSGHQEVLIASLIGAIVWAFACTHLGIPISITHSMVGGIMGAVIVSQGITVLKWAGIKKILLAMIISPIAGFAGAYIFMFLMLWLFRRARPGWANKFFRKGQIFTAGLVALTHGCNDTQNAMGIIAAALVIAGFIPFFYVPVWVILISALIMGLGTYISGWRVIRTLGQRLLKVTPVHGFCSEFTSAGVMLGASLMGAPISTTHVVSTSVMGAGATKKLTAVRWGVAGNIVITWILTFPGSALIGALSCLVLQYFLSK